MKIIELTFLPTSCFNKLKSSLAPMDGEAVLYQSTWLYLSKSFISEWNNLFTCFLSTIYFQQHRCFEDHRMRKCVDSMGNYTLRLQWAFSISLCVCIILLPFSSPSWWLELCGAVAWKEAVEEWKIECWFFIYNDLIDNLIKDVFEPRTAPRSLTLLDTKFPLWLWNCQTIMAKLRSFSKTILETFWLVNYLGQVTSPFHVNGRFTYKCGISIPPWFTNERPSYGWGNFEHALSY